MSTNATAKLNPNLDESYKIENNNKEADARLVSRTTDFEARVLSIFVKQDLANLLPSEVCLHRVGPYNTPSPNKGRAFSPPLAIADIEGASAETGSVGGNRPKLLPGVPKCWGGVVGAHAPPPW